MYQGVISENERRCSLDVMKVNVMIKLKYLELLDYHTRWTLKDEYR